MKNSTLLAILFVTFLASCKKEEVKPANVNSTNPTSVSNTQRNIQVRYHVYAVSGNVKVTSLVPINGTLTSQTQLVTRLNHEIIIDYKSGHKFMLEATNTNPSTDEVIVELYVDGVLIKSNSVNAPGATAKVEAFVNN